MGTSLVAVKPNMVKWATLVAACCYGLPPLVQKKTSPPALPEFA
jgi:hypothetical protein